MNPGCLNYVFNPELKNTEMVPKAGETRTGDQIDRCGRPTGLDKLQATSAMEEHGFAY